MDTTPHFKALNRRLIRGEHLSFFDGTGVSPPTSNMEAEKPLIYPRIGIYAGTGTSHSWLWFVDIFDRMGFYDLTFLNERDIQEDGLEGIQVLAMSGGDTFAIAEGLGQAGAQQIEAFIEFGGLYMGSCAGAYLPLNSSKPFLNAFNFVPAKITNLTRTLSEPIRMKEKFCTSYGCSFIFHPVRESVTVETNGFAPFGKAKRLQAPLYGGPPMTISDQSTVLATYTGFTDKTLFLVDPVLATKTLIGKAAVIREEMGKGHLHLYGPHFEHPRFHKANELLVRAMYWDTNAKPEGATPIRDSILPIDGKASCDFVRAIKRHVSNARIVAAGLEMRPVQWTLGRKLYDPGKIRVFLDAIWSRLRSLERVDRVFLKPGQEQSLIDRTAAVTSRLRELKRGMDRNMETVKTAADLFADLRQSATLFLDVYFRTVRNQFGGQHAV